MTRSPRSPLGTVNKFNISLSPETFGEVGRLLPQERTPAKLGY